MEKTDVNTNIMVNKKTHAGGQCSVRKILCWLLACSLLAAQFDTTVLAAEQTGIDILAESEAAGDTENNDDAEAVDGHEEDGEMDEADENAENDDADAVNEIVGDSETDRAKEGEGADISSGSEAGGKSDTSDKSAESKNESESGNSDAADSVENPSGSSEDLSGSIESVGESESSSGTNIVVSRNADVVFVIDATASMKDEITRVREKLIEFVGLMDQAGVDVRVRFVVYYDIINDPLLTTKLSDWYTGEQINDALSYINSIVVTGGGDGPETALDGIGQLFQDEFDWRESVAKFSILLTDATYKENNTFNYTFEKITDMLSANGISSSAIVPTYVSDYDDWIVNGGKKGNIDSSDYSFLLDWVEDVILPNVDMKYHNVNIEVKKDNVSWMGHGKNFILKNIDKGFYVGNLNAVENGYYQIYEVIAGDSYLYTGRTITVDEEDAAAVVDYYTMTFHDGDVAYGDDTAQHKRIIVSGLTTTEPDNPEKNGYTFKQWGTEKGGHTGFDFSKPISGTVNLYAEWISNGVDIKARKDDTLWEDSGRRYCLRPYVNSEESLASVISENDVFSDYITDLNSVSNGRYRVYELYITQVPDGDDIVNYVDTGMDFTVTDDNRTIYVDYYTVTFHDGDTIYGDATSQHSQIVMKNKNALEPVKPVKECYVFNRWLTEKNGDTAFSFNQAVTGTTNLYAGWRDNRVTVNVRKDDIQWTGHGKLFGLKKATEDSYITLLTSVENGEYRVYEIYDNGEMNAPEYRDTGAVVTVNNGDATVNVDYYTVTFYNGIVAYGDEEPQHRQIILKNHTAYEPPNPTKTGYSFVNWMTERENGIPFDFTRKIDAPVRVYADWTPNMVIITVRKDGDLWDNHGKIFCITKDGGETYITDLSAVESGIYDVYEMIPTADAETPRYLDTGVNVTVTGGRVSSLIDYYTVTFYDKTNAYDDATAQGRQIVIKNGNAVKPAKNPTKKGYRFKKWVTENKGKVAFDFSTKISEPVSIYASWAAKSSGSSDPEPVPEAKRNEPEPRTGDNYHVEIYASVAMIAGFGYLLLYFAENAGGMSEYQKDKLLSAITSWARKGSRMRRYVAIAAVFCVLCYYHSIGKRVAMEWETFA